MKQEDVKTISELLRDAFGVFEKRMDEKMDRRFNGLTRLTIEHFTETDTKIEKIVDAPSRRCNYE